MWGGEHPQASAFQFVEDGRAAATACCDGTGGTVHLWDLSGSEPQLRVLVDPLVKWSGPELNNNPDVLCAGPAQAGECYNLGKALEEKKNPEAELWLNAACKHYTGFCMARGRDLDAARSRFLVIDNRWKEIKPFYEKAFTEIPEAGYLLGIIAQAEGDMAKAKDLFWKSCAEGYPMSCSSHLGDLSAAGLSPKALRQAEDEVCRANPGGCLQFASERFREDPEQAKRFFALACANGLDDLGCPDKPPW